MSFAPRSTGPARPRIPPGTRAEIGWVAVVLPLRMFAQRLIDRGASHDLDEALQIARLEQAPLTTDLPDDSGLPDGSPSGERTH
jgi:hypothetical protein